MKLKGANGRAPPAPISLKSLEFNLRFGWTNLSLVKNITVEPQRKFSDITFQKDIQIHHILKATTRVWTWIRSCG